MIEEQKRLLFLERVRTPDSPLLKGTLLMTSTLTVMAGATIAPALPALQQLFADIPNAAFWVRLILTMPALFIVIGAPIAGYVVDRLGRKKLLVAATVLYGIAGGSGFVADSLVTLLIGRAFLGLAVGALMTSVTTLITDYYSGQARAQFLGFQAAFMGLGGTLFLTLGGFLSDVSWRAPFLIYLLSFAILPFIVVVLYEPVREPSQPPILAPLSGPDDCAAAAQRAAGQTSGQVAEQVPLRLLFFIYTLVVFIQIVFYLVPVQLPFYLETLTGATATQSGMAIASISLFFALASSQFGRFDARFQRITVMLLAFLLTGTGYLLIGQAGGWGLVLLGLPISGFGIGLLMPNLNVWLANSTPAAVRGRALGGFATAIFLGQFLSPIVSQPITQEIGLAATYALFGMVLLGLALVTSIRRATLKRKPHSAQRKTL